MRVLIIFPVLLVHVASVFSIYLKSVELGEVKLEPLENIYSNHIPQYLEPLNLTTGELKLFAGHSFQLIKAKCPAVSQERLGLVSKYIAKLISRNNPLPGSSPAFKDLVTTISTCTEHQITDEEKAQRDMSFFQFFFHPLRSFRNLFGFSKSADNKDDASTEGSSTVVPPDTLPLDAESEPAQVVNLKDMDKMPSFFGKDDDDNDDAAIPSSSVSPDLDAEAQDAANTPLIRIFFTSTGDDGFDPWNPMGWLGGVFNAIRNLVAGIFGAPQPEDSATVTEIPIPDSVSRAKRDAGDAPTSILQPVEKIEVQETEVIEKDEKDREETPLKGREAFMALIDNLCRIYCNECLGQEQVSNFKAAAKELLQLILTDTTGMELASKHFLEPDFLQSLNDC